MEPDSLNLGARWKLALKVLFLPASIGLLLLTVSLVISAVAARESLYVASVATALAGLVASVLGGVWHANWSRQLQQGPLREHGETAVRGLRLLLQDLSALDRRLHEYLRRFGKQDKSDTLTLALEETIEKTTALQERAMNAVEDWKGIVPEATAITQAGMITALKQQAANLERAIEEKEKALAGEAEKNTTARKRLEGQLEDARKELKSTRDEVTKLRSESISPLVLGSGRTGLFTPSFIGASTLGSKCPHCSRNQPKLLSLTGNCEYCGKSLSG